MDRRIHEVEALLAGETEVGATTQRANAADLQRLHERRPDHRLPFDTRPFRGATLADLDLRGLRSEHTADREVDADIDSFPSFESWLVQRQVARRVHDEVVPTGAGVLLHGKSPQDLLPGAFLDLVRYAGCDHDAEIRGRRVATGTLPDQLDVCWAWIAMHIEDRPVRSGELREAFVPDYPVEALKELVRNLVQHRLYEGTNAPGRVEWFDDRIEFSNPGGPFGRASEGAFGDHSDYRNPLLTSGLVRLGYVQQLGRGVRRASLLLERNGNPPWSVEVDGFTRVIVRRRP